ncbi:General alpha-glucoside permease [Wickerhamomyces ciferrii]|uniref:General alpha-glucoside permease n=1 Tax=Wickerhamomyces ciferrii (strain ATCC 14091 / BCRC 22168 / CBS 111 / JCM 3599 / NBRC 0793 / NRRL Y-1031 F-60-10) TaxID=1206466 RepID=K0KH14_WICCF|nr:General alpha-glucoside permease [Wickerhamomyces ciferrii]CCH41477.1 General alpha-glucoside permease [Wickerhamomyces ciferrii]
MTTEYVEDVRHPEEKEVNGLSKKLTEDSELSEKNEVENYLAKFLNISNNAQSNENSEKNMTLKEGLTTFPKAAMWSIILSSSIIMEGYDTNLINSLFAFPAFTKKFGEYYEDINDYQIPTKWQNSLSMGVYCGELIGLFIAGLVADRLGYRKTLISALTSIIGLIFIVFFAVNVGMLLAGEILLGVAWGMLQTLVITYAADVCPLVLRVYLTTYINACWVIGQLISSGVLRGVLSLESASSYQIPFAIQWVWPLPIIIGIYLAPESPWWLVRKGKAKEAKNSIRRLLTVNKNTPDVDVLSTAMFNKMQLTIQEENSISKETGYKECFKNGNFRRTRIAAMIWLFQSITGSAFMGFSTYFYQQAGLASSMAFTFSIIQYCLGLIGTLSSWVLSQKLGRFTIYFSGLCIQFIVLITVGALGFSDSKGASWAAGSLLLVFTLAYNCTVGPITYCAVAEMPTVRLRNKTVIIARNCYNVAGIVTSIITPYMLNPTGWNWKAKSGLFWAGFTLIAIIWCWCEFPETKGRTFAELNQLFQDNVPARKFKYTTPEVFNAQKMVNNMNDEELREIVEADKDKIYETKA